MTNKLYFTDIQKEIERLNQFVKSDVLRLRNETFFTREDIDSNKELIEQTESIFNDYLFLLDNILRLHLTAPDTIDVVNDVRYIKALEIASKIDGLCLLLVKDAYGKLHNNKSIISRVYSILLDISIPPQSATSKNKKILQLLCSDLRLLDKNLPSLPSRNRPVYNTESPEEWAKRAQKSQEEAHRESLEFSRNGGRCIRVTSEEMLKLFPDND